jgi:hypothetical protein
MFMHSSSNFVTLDRNKLDWNELYKDPVKQKSCPVKFVSPNAGVGDELSSEDDKYDDVDDAITQVDVGEFSSADESVVTPKKRKASEVSHSIELLDSE